MMKWRDIRHLPWKQAWETLCDLMELLVLVGAAYFVTLAAFTDDPARESQDLLWAIFLGVAYLISRTRT